MAYPRLDTMRRAMLPLDGSIAEHVPAIVAAYARLVPVRDWPKLTVVDLTAGSCLLSLLFGARDVGRLVINDLAPRSQLAAAALFGGRTIDRRRVEALLAAGTPRLLPHVPSFHFACDYLTADVADAFDRLFHARLAAADRPAYRYLALRWALGFAPSAEEPFEILPTHDYRQLRDDLDHDWGPFIRRARRKRQVLARLAADINAAVACVNARRVEIHGTDMRDLCRTIDFGGRVFMVANPPTRGLDEYVIDDQLAHSLLANRWLPLSQSRESAKELWTSCVETALRRLPRGGHALVWGGDGAMSWAACWRVWRRLAMPVIVRRVGRGAHAPGWAILEKP